MSSLQLPTLPQDVILYMFEGVIRDYEVSIHGKCPCEFELDQFKDLRNFACLDRQISTRFRSFLCRVNEFIAKYCPIGGIFRRVKIIPFLQNWDMDGGIVGAVGEVGCVGPTGPQGCTGLVGCTGAQPKDKKGTQLEYKEFRMVNRSKKVHNDKMMATKCKNLNSTWKRRFERQSYQRQNYKW